jgi:HAD superfamily hydrolase (TIGR01662 family)
MKKNTAVFLDRDGVINEEVGYLDGLEKLKVIPNACKAIQMINQSGMKAIVISNQSGVARGLSRKNSCKPPTAIYRKFSKHTEPLLMIFITVPIIPPKAKRLTAKFAIAANRLRECCCARRGI